MVTSNDLRFDEQVAVISGAGGGLGKQLIAQPMLAGAGTPRVTSFSATRGQPASIQTRTDSLKASGSVTSCVCGSKVGGLRSPSANARPAARRPGLSVAEAAMAALQQPPHPLRSIN